MSVLATPRVLSISAQVQSEIDEPAQMMTRGERTSVLGFTVNNQNAVFNAPVQNPSDLGVEIEPAVLSEDFSLMSTGTLERPDIWTNLVSNNYEYPWANMKDGYTHEPLWGCDNVFPAGGAAFLDASEEVGGGARLTTPRVNLAGNGGVATISFKIRSFNPGEVAYGFGVEAYETNDWAPDWGTVALADGFVITNEWTTIEIVVQGAGPTTLFNMYTYGTSLLIDDLKIVQYDLYVGIPVLNKHTNYTGSSFDISWSAVEGADSYLVNVYNEQGVYLLEDAPAETNKFTVEGIDSGKTYYYTVRAVKGEHQSLETHPMEVYDLEAPSILETFKIEGTQDYVVSWTEVPTAEMYNYWLYADRVAEADGEFVLTNETFEGLKDMDGTPATREIDTYKEAQHYDEYFPQTLQGGWKALMGIPFIDCIGLDGWMYVNAGKDAGLLSPELDLSKDNGIVKIDLSLCGELTFGWNWNDEWVENVTAQCAVALFNYDEELGDYTQAELVYVKDVNENWQDFTVTLTKGSERSVIGIYAVRAEGYLYVGNMKITQNYKAGEKLRDPIYTEMRYIDGTELEVTVPDRGCGLDLWHKVCAGKGRLTMEDGGLTETLNVKESAYSELEYIGIIQSGVESLSFDGISVNVNNEVLNVVNPLAEAVKVFSVSGALIYSNAGAETVEVVLPAEGVYVVQIGKKAVKVIR